MERKFVWDGTEADMDRLKAENAFDKDGGTPLQLVEVQNHFDGNFLVFGDKTRG
ncbi:MAG TPA: hypothetical protein VFF54_08625 [Thermodesulfobacteriota bacterium]|nr:hypothetical protein [Thermodesulfobacteriota bacterium]